MILFIDNESGRMKEWILALRAEFGEVKVCSGAAQAFEFFRSADVGRVQLLVWDLMMPTEGGLTDDETDCGYRTGEQVHAAFRKVRPDTPAILLTQAIDDALFRRYNHPPRDRAGRKRFVMPEDLVQWAREAGVTSEPPAVR